MKRWLLILLIALLPLQFSWAAVGAYCGDEHESPQEHAMHASGSSPAESDSLDRAGAAANLSDPSAAPDFDCGTHCHGHASSLPAATLQLIGPTSGASWLDECAVRRVMLVTARPDRPQWQTLA
jgi:hypothetical protein